MKIGFSQPRLPQEPRRRRGDAGHGARGRPRDHERRRDADVLVVNTCAFIDSAKQESIDAILEMAAAEARRAAARVWSSPAASPSATATSCEGDSGDRRRARHGRGRGDRLEAIGARGSGLGGSRRSERCPAATLLFPVAAHWHAIPSRRAPNPEPRSLPPISTTPTTPRYLTTPQHFAYVKIAEGCDYTCAFCIIPTLRGQYRSRTADSIVAEARAAGRARRHASCC